MINQIAYQLVKNIADNVPFADKWAGLVKPLRKKVQNVDKVFPVSINTPTTCDISDYTALVPDKDKMSVIYAELSEQPSFDGARVMSAGLRIVVWYNLDLILQSHSISEDSIADRIFTNIPLRMPDSLFTGARQVHFVVTGITYGSEVVSQYTYNELKTQFAMHPYGILAIDVDTWYVPTHCQPALDQGQSCMTGYGNHQTSEQV